MNTNTKFISMPLFFLVLSCSSSNQSQLQNSSMIDTNDGAIVAQYMSNSANSDIQNSSDPTSLVLGAFAGLSFPSTDAMVAPQAGCLAIDNLSSSSENDVIFNFSCPHMTGTIEIKGSKTNKTFSYDSQLAITAGSTQSSLDSSFSIAINAGNVSIQKQFDNTFTGNSNAYEAKGSHSYTFTPDNTATPHNAGAVQLNGSFEIFKNGTETESFNAISSNLHRSSCGFDSGSIEYQGLKHDIVVTFNGCGNRSITDNGVAVP